MSFETFSCWYHRLYAVFCVFYLCYLIYYIYRLIRFMCLLSKHKKLTKQL